MRPWAEKLWKWVLKISPQNWICSKYFVQDFRSPSSFMPKLSPATLYFNRFFLPSNNHLDLTLNETNIKINSYFFSSQSLILGLIHHPCQCMCETVNKKFKKFQQKFSQFFSISTNGYILTNWYLPPSTKGQETRHEVLISNRWSICGLQLLPLHRDVVPLHRSISFIHRNRFS